MYFSNRAFYSLKIAPTARLSGLATGGVVTKDGEKGVEDRSEGRRGKLEEEQGGGIDNPISAVSTVQCWMDIRRIPESRGSKSWEYFTTDATFDGVVVAFRIFRANEP